MKRLAGAVVLLLALGVAPAGAAAPRDQGWWTVTNPVPAPPDVPARGLVAQGGPNGPTAYAAVLYELDPGSAAGTLTLAVAPNTATTPAPLQLCRLLQSIVHPEQGGPMADAPAYDCSKSVTASPEGNAYHFAVADLAADNLVAVAILPSGPADRVVLNEPDDASLTTTPGALAATGTTDADAFAADVSSVPDVAPAGDLYPGADVLAPPSAVAGLPEVAPPAAVSTAPASADTPFVLPASTTAEKATPLLVLLLVLGALAGPALWFYAGREQPSTPTPTATPS